MRVNSIECSSMHKHNSSNSNLKNSMIKNNNTAFGTYFSHGTQVWEKADYANLERLGQFFAKLSSGVLDPKRKVPKDGVWAIGKLKEMINPDRLIDYKKRHVHIKETVQDGNITKEITHNVMRTTFYDRLKQICYKQDLYPNGKLETEIKRWGPRGKILELQTWTENINFYA